MYVKCFLRLTSANRGLIQVLKILDSRTIHFLDFAEGIEMESYLLPNIRFRFFPKSCTTPTPHTRSHLDPGTQKPEPRTRNPEPGTRKTKNSKKLVKIKIKNV